MGKAKEAVETFVRMRDQGFEADEVTKRHFGKIKLGGVARSVWDKSVRDVREAQGDEQAAQQQQVDQQGKEEGVMTQSGDGEVGSDDTNELAEGVRAMSV